MTKKSFLQKSLFILLCFISVLHSFSQNNLKVTGQVNDEAGKAIPGVTVTVKETRVSTMTKTDGTFEITIPSGTSVLIITSVGYADQEIAVNNRSSITVTMQTAASSLQDVVVIGYGTQKKKNVTSAVANFDARNLDQRPVLRVDQALVGQMAGVTVKQTSGALGRGISIQVRGTGSISAGNEPLFVIGRIPGFCSKPESKRRIYNRKPS